jgi:AcrR family transcriptional regulator
MARRGEELRTHILYAAKEVFLEHGFERASMDQVAARAQTSKRTLYAHFASKEALYLAIVEYVRGVSLERVKTPADYSGPPREALAQFLARFMQSALHGPAIQMARMSIGAASRFPDGAAEYFEVAFQSVAERIAAFLRSTYRLTPRTAHDAANALLGRILIPRFLRALFAVDPLPPAIPMPPATPPLAEADLGLARELIAEIIDPLIERETTRSQARGTQR